MSHEQKTKSAKNRAVEMSVPWKAWKTNPRFSTLPTAPWKSLRDSHIPTAPTTGPFYLMKQNPDGRGASPLAYQLRVVVVDREK
jgi:hypothetical protein